MRILVLAGTAEARAVAAGLVAAGHDVTVSLAGVTAAPRALPGRLRTGGFGGAEGLAAFLRAARTELLVDAAHPFAARISAHAAGAAAALGLPLLRVERPAWPVRPGWQVVPDLAAAAGAIPPGATVFLTTGRRSFPAFLHRTDCRFVARAAEPGPFPFARGRLVTGLPPFGEAAERALMAAEGVGLLLARNSGGEAAKLEAAAALGLPVLMVARPPKPPAPTVPDAADALARIAGCGA